MKTDSKIWREEKKKPPFTCVITFPCRIIFGELPVMSTTVDGSATLMPPLTTKSRPYRN